MRVKLAAALAATALAATGFAATGLAAAGTALAQDGARKSVQLKSAVTAEGNLRLSGADRYETAVEVSESAWDASNTVAVYLASGTSLPDALAAAPSMLGLGPLLLTRADALPAVTRAELQRLEPCQVVVVGGTGVVSDAVLAEAEQYADAARCSVATP